MVEEHQPTVNLLMTVLVAAAVAAAEALIKGQTEAAALYLFIAKGEQTKWKIMQKSMTAYV